MIWTTVQMYNETDLNSGTDIVINLIWTTVRIQNKNDWDNGTDIE